MFRTNCRWGIIICLIILCFPAISAAGRPTDQIKETTDKIISVVSDPSLKGPEKNEERKKLIRQFANERFDWEEMSRRSLAQHWAERTEEEKKEFVDLFGKLVERTYLEKVEGYSGEKVVYENERVKGEYGLVKVKIVTQKQVEIPVLYRIKNKEENWLVYDISIEGVSLINNYRTQFRSIISRSSYNDLVEKLKAKIDEN